MRMDIRWPVGLFFATLGVLLVAYGLVSSPAIYEKSLWINLNLQWGGMLLLFGVIMAFLGRRRKIPPPADGAAPGSGSADPA
ncbi:MAG TPA: hypothetical protein VKG84_00350 [Candidatus Acidoferrales bacterium]|nr:hypothetical protein [Candidatus Acidoferrales bacterium]